MSKFLQRLQKEVLDKFPFSISGYNYPDKEYEEFFRRICKFQESLENDNKIHFTISGFAKLTATSNLSEAELDKWETESLKYLLFNDNYLGFSEPILSLYVALLQHLSPDKRIVNILAENVNNSILIKILLNDNLEKIQFSFIKSDNTLLIEVPFSYFNGYENKNKDSLQNIFNDINQDCDLIVERESSSSSYSISLTDDKLSKFSQMLERLLNLTNVTTISELTPENVYDRLLKEVLRNNKYNPKEIYSLVFASAILCYFYDCSLTYFVSTARVANNKRYTLGAMGIGLKAGNDLTDNDKALYSILVNHLAANLSTQLIFESNKHLNRENDRKNLKEALEEVAKLDTQVLHGTNAAENGFDSAFNNIYEKYKDILSDYFIQSYKTLKLANCNHISKYCLVKLINSGDCGDCNIAVRPKIFKSSFGEKCCSSIGNMDLINMPLIEALFDKITTEERENAVTLEKCELTDDREIVFEIAYSKGFNVKEFVSKLKTSHNGSLIGEFFINKYRALDCHGIFKMIDTNSQQEFFNSRETIQRVDKNEKKIIINEHYQFPESINSTNKIKIVFKNEL